MYTNRKKLLFTRIFCVPNRIEKEPEPEPEPIPNILKSKSPERDDFYTNFEKLRQRMNEARILAQKGRIHTQHTQCVTHTLYTIDSELQFYISADASNGSNASGQASPIQQPSIDE